MATLKRKMLYQQLTDFILTQLPKSYRRNFLSWIENGKLINQGKNVTEQGLEIAHIKYDAVLWFEAFPYQEISPLSIMALIQLWLDKHDELRYQLNMFESDFEIELLDDEKTADFSLTISFQEPLTAIKDEYGDLDIEGEHFRLEEIEINIAEEIEVQAQIEMNTHGT